MSCRIKLYEASRTLPRSHVSLRSSTVQLVAVEQARLANCCPVQANRRLLGGGFGADLPFIPAPFVYQVAIVDTAQIYAGATVPNLNADVPVDLDVVLFHLPTIVGYKHRPKISSAQEQARPMGSRLGWDWARQEGAALPRRTHCRRGGLATGAGP